MKPFLILVLIYFAVLNLFTPKTFAQSSKHNITGQVVNSKGEKISGVYIFYFYNEEKKGETSDEQGNFDLSIPIEVKQIFIKMMGYKERKVQIKKNKLYYRVELTEDIIEIEESVITGYVDKSATSYTGSMYTIKKEEIQRLSHINLITIIETQSPGFEITDDIDNGSNPNQIPELILRGRSSFIEGDRTNTPIFILDGSEVSVEFIFNMDPNDVEQVSILKDASATSFYGSKAANGVIVITTRPTRLGKLQVNYNGSFQVESPDLSSYKLLNAREKLKYEFLANLYGDLMGTSKHEIAKQRLYYSKLSNINKGIDSDWKRQALRTSTNRRHNINLSGGNEDFKYGISGSYNKVAGIMEKSGKSSYSIRTNLTYGNLSKFFFQNITSINFATSSDIPYGNFSDYLKLAPYDPIYMEDGNINNNLAFNLPNPLFEQNLNSYIKAATHNIINTLKFRYNITTNLRVEGGLSYQLTKGENSTFFSPLSKRFVFTPPLEKGSFSISNSEQKRISGNAFIVYNNLWKEKNLFYLTGGINIESSTLEHHGVKGIGVLSDKINHISMATQYPKGGSPGGGESNDRMLGFFSNINYIWDNRLFTDITFRYEGSSKFGTNNKFAPFGSLGVGWNIHNESFISDKHISLLKLRLSCGVVGNASFAPYQAILHYVYNPILNYNGAIGAIPIGMVNPELKWEKSLNRNIGLDIGLWKNKLNLSLEFYSNTTTNLIIDVSKPPHIGFATSKENLGKISNKGFDASVRSTLIRNNNSQLNMFFTVSHNKNTIKSINNYLKNINDKNEKEEHIKPSYMYEEGESMTAIKVMISGGINPANGREIFIKKNGEYTYLYDYKDKVIVGDRTPVIQGVLGATYNYKQFELTLNLSYRLGATVYNQTLASKVEGSNPIYNADKRVLYDRWKEPGDRAKYKRITEHRSPVSSTRFIAKDYSLRAMSIKLSYNFTPSICKKLSLRFINCSIASGDLFSFSSIKQERGLNYPFARKIQFSLSIGV